MYYHQGAGNEKSLTMKGINRLTKQIETKERGFVFFLPHSSSIIQHHQGTRTTVTYIDIADVR